MFTHATKETSMDSPLRPLVTGSVLRRKCNCGNHTIGGTECDACRSQGLSQHQNVISRQIQAKFVVGRPEDFAEKEADRIAEAVVRSWDTKSFSSSKSSGQTETPKRLSNQVQGEAAVNTLLRFSEARIQRQVCSIESHDIPLSADEVEDEDKKTSAASEKVVKAKLSDSVSIRRATTVPGSNIFSSSFGSSSGEPLTTQVQQQMGQRFGADFSSVRVHTDSQAVQMNQTLGARAFTYGADIYFNRGEFNPGTRDGKYLLAHELTHTLQQNGNTIRRLAVNPVGTLTKGVCGSYLRKWDFQLGAAAAEAGYIVQKLDFYEDYVNCPSSGRCLANPTLTFWEAWPVKKSDTFHEKHSAGYTDKSSSGGKDKKAGYVAAAGEIKFFTKSVSGDLGTYGIAPGSPNGGWGPNNSGQSGSLPSTLTEPSWWGSGASEGPVKRIADASWRCCGDASDFNTIRADP